MNRTNKYYLYSQADERISVFFIRGDFWTHLCNVQKLKGKFALLLQLVRSGNKFFTWEVGDGDTINDCPFAGLRVKFKKEIEKDFYLPSQVTGKE